MARKVATRHRPEDTIFLQQKLRSCTIILKPHAVVGLFYAIGLLFMIIGLLIVLASSHVVEVSIPYEASCCASCSDDEGPRVDHNPCFVNFSVSEDLEPPVYVYYRLTSYYANHKQFVRSRDEKQLMGDSGMKPNDLDCQYDKNFARGQYEDGMFPGTYETSNNTMANVISPCGLVARAWFNDSFAVRDESGHTVRIDQTEIAWGTDVLDKFANAADGSTGDGFEPFRRWKEAACNDLDEAKVSECEAAQDAATVSVPGWCYPGSGHCNEDEHFIVWMRTAALADARKLYGRVVDEQGRSAKLASGEYTLQVSSGDGSQPLLYPVYSFGGDKEVVISTVSWLKGGKNSFLGLAYLGTGAIFILFATAFFAKHQSAHRLPGRAPFIDKFA